YIACSASEQQSVRAAIPFRTCQLVENAVMPPQHTLPSFRNPMRIITVGQIRPQKNPLQFLEIAKALKAVYPQADLVWVGNGDPDVRNLLEMAGVCVTGWLQKGEVWRLLSTAGVYLSTSRWEGMPV